MVAFVGAVICIIAAVHTGSSRAAAAQQRPPADNHSLYPDAHQSRGASGSVARPGSLGALHGSDTPDSESPTFNVGLGGLDGVSGLTGHDPTVSRLICTPIPAGECNPKNFQQQADDPSLYAGEDWGYLRTTAEELRQTVLQQKDQILTDQRTIQELTGKLTECEKGLDGKSIAERRGSAAGLWGGRATAEETHLERVMVRDSPGSTPESGHLLTVRAVDELEQAITQLKDRIEKLEADVGPSTHNQTDSSPSGAPGEGVATGGQERLADPGQRAGAERPCRVEDLEGELEKKVELLEKERKSLRTGGRCLRAFFPRGLQAVLSNSDKTYMYAVVKHAIPALRALKRVPVAAAPQREGSGTRSLYAVSKHPNELVLMQGLHTPAELLINDKVAQLPLNLSKGSWQHICVTWSQKGGAWQAYQGGKLRGEGRGVAAGHHVRPGGVLILGQEQDSLGGSFDSSQALVGEFIPGGYLGPGAVFHQVASLARLWQVTQGSVPTGPREREWMVNGEQRRTLGSLVVNTNRNSQ
ncbi:hypothetical protein KUCAC02_007172 [Chaenocephalus aceratus]|uniref:Uncharacterized protein n=1 Tax=Chaenocephalus aceratus TaxID=36190 RepID=A0ACB9X5B8_CHAAC|nr:hypothetical protein KUCAC02_007172 [Chaenocephalus aceratus]